MPCTHRRPGRPRAQRSDRLGPGRSAAPGEQRLSLLPSGPDEVHASPLRGTRSSTSISPPASASAGLGWEFSPAGADCRYRAPLVPRLARPANDSPPADAADFGLQARPIVGEVDTHWISRLEPVDRSPRWRHRLQPRPDVLAPERLHAHPPRRHSPRRCTRPGRRGPSGPLSFRLRLTGVPRCDPAWRGHACRAAARSRRARSSYVAPVKVDPFEDRVVTGLGDVATRPVGRRSARPGRGCSGRRDRCADGS